MSDPWRTWMPLDIGRYLKDTGRLSTIEHGAYLLLIMDYWNAGSLPQDDNSLCSIARLQPKQWQLMKPKIAAFFRPDWTHKKVEKELAEAEQKYLRRSKAGHKGGVAKQQRRGNEDVVEDGNAPSIATSIEDGAAIHKAQQTPSDDGMWVSVRERVTRAFEAAGSPNSPDTSRVEIWKSRGWDPNVCLATVTEIVTKRPTISSLAYFDKPIADAHFIPQGQARAGPRRAAGGDERHDFIEKLRARRDGNPDHHEGDSAEDADIGPGAHLERLPQPH